MRVYLVVLSVPYEGYDVLGVFGSREDAVWFIHEQEGYPRDCYGVVESDLGQRIDLDTMFEQV